MWIHNYNNTWQQCQVKAIHLKITSGNIGNRMGKIELYI
jgi:hypothetical protein